MGSYGVIKEALLVKYNKATDKYDVVQKLVPATVNGVVISNKNGGFELGGQAMSVFSVYRGGAFGFSEEDKDGDAAISVNIPGSGVKHFKGNPLIQSVNGVGQCVLCRASVSDSTAPYTHLCLVVDEPGNVFAENPAG